MNELVSKVDDLEPVSSDLPAELPSNISPLVAMLASGQLQAEHVAQAMKLQKAHDEYEAKKAYSVALANFRKIAPTLKKDAVVDFTNKHNLRTYYKHTSLGYTLTEVNPLLGQCDLNLSWHPRQSDGLVYVVTRLTHISGHYEEVELFAQPDNSGNKNPMQAVSSSITYLKREGAKSILGLASEDDYDDDDGRSAYPTQDNAPAVEMLDESDMRDIEAVCTECGMNYEKYLQFASNKRPFVDGLLIGPKTDKAKMIKQIRNNAKSE